MANPLAAGENDPPGGGGGGRENDGPGGRFAGSDGVMPFNLGPLPGWDDIFDPPKQATAFNPPAQHIIFGAKFPDTGWDPIARVEMIVREFTMLNCWRALTTMEPPPDHLEAGADQQAIDNAKAALRADVVGLLHLRKDLGVLKPTFTDEINAQNADFTPYFQKLLSCSAQVRPATYYLVITCILAGAVVARFYKEKYKRARPAQVLPSFETLIATPRHPSYPSGHALQSFLIAEAVADVANAMAPRAKQVATRIAVNREQAGVHFPSDTAASQKIAKEVWDCLKTTPGIKDFIDGAKNDFDKIQSIPLV